MSSRQTDDDEARLAWLLSQFQDQQDHDAPEPRTLESLESELDSLSAEELEELVEGNDCLRLLQDLSQLGTQNATPELMQASFEGKKVGKYAVVRKLGTGGFADVFFARDTRLGRDVALKILKARYVDDIDVVRRFEREGHAAASLAHPAIIPIFEAGRDGDQTFIAMQFCSGGDLREYLANQKSPLSVRQAAQIGLTISQAIGLAHSKSILHRDIKPANVLLVSPAVDDEPSNSNANPTSDRTSIDALLRVSDFGLVKETKFDPDLTSDGQHDSAIGTPAYMSPEQTECVTELTPTSDVFSIGVVLYELLTGVNPHRKDSRSETFRAIQVEPTNSPRQLRKEIDSDLEAIVMMCLSKSPEARYPTAMQLADDLVRWTQGQAVQARKPNRIEVATRWCQQNPAIAASLLIAISSLLIGTFVSTTKWLDALKQQQVAVEATEQANQLRAQAEKSEQETESLLQVVFKTIAAVDPSRGGDANVNAAEIIRKTKSEIDSKLPNTTEKKWELIRTLAETADGTGDYRLSSELWAEAEQLANQLWTENDPRTTNCLAKRAASLHACGELVLSLQLQSQLLKSFQKRFGKEAPETHKAMADLITLQFEAGRSGMAMETASLDEIPDGAMAGRAHDAVKEAIDLLERHIEWTTERFGEDHESLFPAQLQLSQLHLEVGNRQQALAEIRRAIHYANEHFGESDARTLDAETTRALFALRRDASRAVGITEGIRERAEQRYPATHPIVLRIQRALGLCLWQDGQTQAAIKILQSAQKTCLKTHGPLNPESLSITQVLARTLRLEGDAEQAYKITLGVLGLLRDRVGLRHRGYIELEFVAAQSLHDLERWDESNRILKRLAEMSVESFPEGYSLREKYVGYYWLTLVASNEPEEAIKWIDQFLRDAKVRGGNSRSESLALANKTLCLIQLDREKEAESAFDSFLAITKRRSANHAVGKALRGCFAAKNGATEDAEIDLFAAVTQLEEHQLSKRQHWNAVKQILSTTIDIVSERGHTEAAGRLRKIQDEMFTSSQRSNE